MRCRIPCLQSGPCSLGSVWVPRPLPPIIRRVARPLSSKCHRRDTYSASQQQKEEANIQEHPNNKSGTPKAIISRPPEREDVLTRLFRRLRQLRWARQLRRHEARLRWLARQSQTPPPPPLPPILDPIRTAWLDHAASEHPAWRPGPEGWQLAAHALIQFFDASAASAGKPCALPSRAADLMWHLWLDIDAPGLAAWQQARYGRLLPHREHVPGEDTKQALARCLVRACRIERRSPVKGELPLLFRLDRLLNTPEGWAYQRRRDRVLVHRDLDSLGQPQPYVWRHDELRPAALLGFGLIGIKEANLQPRREDSRGGDGGGSSCGSGCGVGGGSGGCDGDGGSGSSCGSSCGSGCGS